MADLWGWFANPDEEYDDTDDTDDEYDPSEEKDGEDTGDPDWEKAFDQAEEDYNNS